MRIGRAKMPALPAATVLITLIFEHMKTAVTLLNLEKDLTAPISKSNTINPVDERREEKLTTRHIVIAFAALFALNLVLRVFYLRYDFVNGDEGVRALTAIRLIEGARLYSDIVTDKPPGTTLFYSAVLALFGRSMDAVHLAAAVWNFATAIVVYLTAVMIYGRRAGLWASFFLIYFSTNYMTQDMMAANTEMLMALPYTAAFYFFIRASMRGRNRRGVSINLFIAGVMTALATLFKQVGVFNLAFFAMYELFVTYVTWPQAPSNRALWIRKRIKESLTRLSPIAAGFALTLALFVLWLIGQGTFSDFWRNVVELNFFYVGSMPRDLWFRFFVNRTLSYILFNASLFSLAIWAVAHAAKRLNRDRQDKQDGCAQIQSETNNPEYPVHPCFDMTVALWGVASFAAVFPGGRFFGHYFIQLLPALSLLASRGVELLRKPLSNPAHKLRVRIVTAILITLFLVGFVRFHQRTATLAYETLTGRDTGRTDRWGMSEREREAEIISRQIRNRLSQGEPLYIWGYALDIYWKTECRPASRYLTPYYITGQFTDAALTEVNPEVEFFREAREHLLEDLRRERPRLILDVYGALLSLPYPEITDFVKKNYSQDDRIGVSPSRPFVVYALKENEQ